MWWARGAIAIAAASLLVSCSFSHLDLTGRPCPCSDGYVCVAEVCQREGSVDASSPHDAPAFDAGPGADAGPGVDGGPGLDGGPRADGGPRRDAGGTDAGPAIDGGTPRDAGPPGTDAGPCHEVTIEVASAGDDGDIESGVWEPDGESGTLECGHAEPDEEIWCYFRFELPVAIPDGADMLEVYLELWSAGSYRWTGDGIHWLWVSFESAADPGVRGGATVPARTPEVRWPGGTDDLVWGTRYQRTPNLASAFEAIPGTRAMRSHVQVWLHGEFTIGDTAVVNTPIHTDDPSDDANRLIIRWCDDGPV